MARPLSPTLYERLRRHFGTVRIAAVGQAFRAMSVRGINNEPRLRFRQRGEHYRVCCFACRDTRFRLYINHMFGQKDGHGRKMTFLAICFNEGCMAKRENLEDLVEKLEDTGLLATERIRDGEVLPLHASEVQWPGYCKLLSKLRADHDANAYLASRGFDTAVLAARFKISYCLDSDYFLARNRIIIPVFEHDKMVGWQARYVGELPWKDKERKRYLPVKYFSCPNSQFRSRCLYNWDEMKRWQTGVVVEGPTDVWRFGAMSGCIFGNTITETQRRKLLAVFRKRVLILLLDPEEFSSRSTLRAVRLFEKRMPGRFCAIKLPVGTDPGSLDRDFLRDYVRQEAADRGVKVVYKRCT